MFKALRVILLLSPLSLGGCVVGEGVAHVVKLIGNKSGESSPPAATAPVTSAPADRAEPAVPPLPMAAPRDEIKVETLPPRR